MYEYQSGNMKGALDYFRKSRIDEEKKGAVDDVVRSGMKEALTLLDLGLLEEVKTLLCCLRELGRNLESKNIEAELEVLELSYHYFRRSPRRTFHHHISAVEAIRDQTKEIPVLLMLDKTLFRAKARYGDLVGAKSSFRKYLKTLKSISDNIQNKDDAARFLEQKDDLLARKEYKLMYGK
jgi:hypothetical protein